MAKEIKSAHDKVKEIAQGVLDTVDAKVSKETAQKASADGKKDAAGEKAAAPKGGKAGSEKKAPVEGK